MSSAADNGRNLGRYDLIVGPAKSPLGETWIARAEVSGGPASDLVTLRRFGADRALSAQEIEVLSEAAGWALSVKQEGVVPTTDLVVAGQQLAWVRPYVLGEPMRRLLQHCASKRQAPSVGVGLRIVVDVLETSVAIAARPHRLASGALLNCCLLGPDVIWISSDGRSRITDVGVLAASGSLDRFHKHPDLAAYRAPEQVGGFLAEPRSDVFVAGILLWELLSGGRHLFGGGELATVVRAVFASRVEEPGEPMSTNRRVDAGAVAVIMRALDRDPTRRFQGPREMLQAIHDLGQEAVAKREDVAAYLASVSDQPLSREREIVAQVMAGARPPKPRAHEPSASAADTRPSNAPLARRTDEAQVTGSQPGRASSPPSATKPDGMVAERTALSSRPSAKQPEAGQTHSPKRSWPVPAKKPRTAASQPTAAASQSSAAKPTGASSHPAAASQPPGTKPNSISPQSSGKKVLAPGIKPVTVSPRPNTTKAPAQRSQPAASSAPPGPAQPARASKPAAEPSSLVAPKEAAGTDLPPAAASPSVSPRASEPSAAAKSEATPTASPPASREAVAEPTEDETTPSSAPVPSMPILSISGSGPEDVDQWGTDQEPAAAQQASTPAVDAAPPDTRTADARPAEGEKGSTAEDASVQARNSASETSASEPEQGRSTWPGFAVQTGAESEAAASGQSSETAGSGEDTSPPGPAAPAEAERRDIAPQEAGAAVAAEPLLDEATTRALKPRSPLAYVLAAAAVLAGGLYWLSSSESASQQQARPVEAEPQKRAPAAAASEAPTAAASEAPTAAAPELSSAAAPVEAAPATAKDEMPAQPEPEEAEPTQKRTPVPEYVAKRARPKPTTQPQASEPARVTKPAGATKARRKPATGSVASKKNTNVLDMLRRLDKEGN